MDIKGIARNLIPFGALKSAPEAKNTRSKTDANNDREGNGQAASEERKRRHLSPEEVNEAVKFLEGLSGVKDNNLLVRVTRNDDIAVVYIEDKDGKVIRRIPETELDLLNQNREKKSGHLLNKAM